MAILPADDYPGILNRQNSADLIRRYMGPSYELLRELLQYGLALMERTIDPTDNSMTRDAALRLYWQLLELLDSVDILVRAGAIHPAQIQARSLVDVALQLLYLLHRNEERVSAAYVTHFSRKRLKSAQTLVMGSQKRKEIEAEAKRTNGLPSGWLDRFPDSTPEVKLIQESLADPMWAEANHEQQQLKDPERWFAAFGGPRNLKALAKIVNLELWARYVYSPFGEPVHGGSPQRVFPLAEGGVRIRPLRDCEDWHGVVDPCYTMTFEVFQAIIGRYREGEVRVFWGWYRQQVRPLLDDRLKLPD